MLELSDTGGRWEAMRPGRWAGARAQRLASETPALAPQEDL